MKKILKCPACEQRIRVEVPARAPLDLDWVTIAVCVFGFFVVAPLALAAAAIWGPR